MRCDDRIGGAFRRDANAGSGFIVRNGLELVTSAQKGAQLGVKFGIVPHQPPKLALNGRVSLEYATMRLNTRPCVSNMSAWAA